MIAVAIIAGLAPAAVTRWQHGSTVTPDGKIYQAMGAGVVVPRPYSLRTFAGFPHHWDALTVVSLIITVVSLYMWANAQYGPTTAVTTCALWGALPSTRRMLTWPVLMDAPSQAVIIGASVVAMWNLPLALAIGIAGHIVHERTVLWVPLMAWATTGEWVAPLIAAVLGMMIYKLRHRATEAHPEEQTVAWLRDPIRTCIANHKAVASDWRVWILPWGAVMAWTMQPTVQTIAAAVLSYGSLLMSMDRVRQYQAVPFILCLGAALCLPAWSVVPACLATSFIPDKVV